MAVKLSPFGNQQFFDSNGDPATGFKLFTYAAGSSTNLTTYTTSAGTVAQTNPIIINSLGFPETGQIWLTEGLDYKIVFTDASNVVKKTADNIRGINDTASSSSQWSASSMTPTYISATTFSVVGDKTADLHVNRRLKFTTTAGTVYGVITAAVFTTFTTITVIMDSTSVLDSGLSTFDLSILTATNSSLPFKQITNTALVDTSVTLTADQVFAGLLSAVPTAARSQTLPTAANIITKMSGSIDGSSFTFNLLNLAGFDETLLTNTGLTLEGSMVINNGSADFLVIRTSSTTVTVRRLAVILRGLGDGQTFQTVTSSRASGTTYTNSTGRPILVSVQANGTAGSATQIQFIIDGVERSNPFSPPIAGVDFQLTVVIIVPAGSTYRVVFAGINLFAWYELR